MEVCVYVVMRNICSWGWVYRDRVRVGGRRGKRMGVVAVWWGLDMWWMGV